MLALPTTTLVLLTRSPITQADLVELMDSSQSPKCWDYRCHTTLTHSDTIIQNASVYKKVHKPIHS